VHGASARLRVTEREKSALLRRLADPFAAARLLGLKGRNEGVRFRALCVFHEEASPSMTLDVGAEGTLRAHCFACHTTADLLTLAMRVWGVGFPEAVRRLGGASERITADFEEPGRGPAAVALLPAPARRVEDLAAVLAAYSGACTFPVFLALRGAVEVAPYLQDRGLSLEVCDAFGVRAHLAADAPFLAARRDVLEGAAPIATLERLGLVTRDGNLSPLASPSRPLVLPWCTADGTVAALQFRTLNPGSRAEDRYRVSGPIGKAAPFGFERALAMVGEPLYVTEGALDACALATLLRAKGRSAAVVAVSSAGTFGDLSAWRRLVAGRDVRLATDADAAGEGAAEALAAFLAPMGARSVERRRPPSKDWGTYLQNTKKGRAL
jgi:DNA primase